MPPLAPRHPRKLSTLRKMNTTNPKATIPTSTMNQSTNQMTSWTTIQMATPTTMYLPMTQKINRTLTVSKRPPLALFHPRKPRRETLFAAKIRMTGRPPTAPLAPLYQRNRPPLKNRSRTPYGFIWHPRPGYPDQEISEPDAQGRVAYKIHMTTAASQLPSRQTDAQRAAELIYRSVIKKYGNP
jgi:hypothetical protein